MKATAGKGVAVGVVVVVDALEGFGVGLAVGLGVGLGVGPEESLLAELLYLDVYR